MIPAIFLDLVVLVFFLGYLITLRARVAVLEKAMREQGATDERTRSIEERERNDVLRAITQLRRFTKCPDDFPVL